jgi:hypothetical protein
VLFLEKTIKGVPRVEKGWEPLVHMVSLTTFFPGAKIPGPAVEISTSTRTRRVSARALTGHGHGARPLNDRYRSDRSRGLYFRTESVSPSDARAALITTAARPAETDFSRPPESRVRVPSGARSVVRVRRFVFHFRADIRSVLCNTSSVGFRRLFRNSCQPYAHVRRR